jgi:hypothetical protein
MILDKNEVIKIIFFNMEALVLVLHFFTPGRGARSMSLDENIYPWTPAMKP